MFQVVSLAQDPHMLPSGLIGFVLQQEGLFPRLYHQVFLFGLLALF